MLFQFTKSAGATAPLYPFRNVTVQLPVVLGTLKAKLMFSGPAAVPSGGGVPVPIAAQAPAGLPKEGPTMNVAPPGPLSSSCMSDCQEPPPASSMLADSVNPVIGPPAGTLKFWLAWAPNPASTPVP